jgi:hypothetical protein
MSDPCAGLLHLVGRFQGLGRGPPPGGGLGNEKDRVAARSSRT